MADPQQVLSARVRDALVAAFGADYADADPLIRPSSFADASRTWPCRWPSSSAGPRATSRPRSSPELDVADMAETPTVSGPGFINFTLTNGWIGAAVTEVLG